MIRAAVTAITLSVLLACAQNVPQQLTFERALDSGPGFTASLVSYVNDGLKLHAMIAVPRSAMPADGFPVVIANHGYVPDPRKYGVTADGVDSRPGDYYRSVPELYTSRGFLVVMPDYRGHNSSEGYEQIAEQNRESVELYADDVLALLALLDSVEDADLNNVFMWSHSMGGAVSMRVLLETGLIKAVSFWSTMNVTELADQFGEINGPVMIHHATGDQTTPHANSEMLAAALELAGHSVAQHSYAVDDHFFEGAQRELAADRDALLFRRVMGQ